MSGKRLTLESLRALVRGREVYIYGAGPRGYIWHKFLSHHGFGIRGFIDKNKSGAGIFAPALLDDWGDRPKPFILIAAQAFYVRQIREVLDARGYVAQCDYVNGARLYDSFPTVETAGICNLRCASCNLGSSLPGRKRGGVMEMGVFTQVFDKLIREIPLLPNLAMYCWGEPLLNPALPEMVAHVESHGVAAELSTNLNYRATLERVIAASPTFFKVSCPGTGEHYEKMHTGGSWKTYLANLHFLRECIDRHNAYTKVEIIYHVYRDNLGKDYDCVKELADGLGFMFQPIIANVFPESIYNYVVHKTPIPETMRQAGEEMVYSIREQISFSQANGRTCSFQSAFPTIRWDGSVIPCCNMEGGEIAANFLDVPLEELKQRQLASDRCQQCMAHGLQRLCSPNGRIEMVNGVRTMVKLR
ncbi:MAG: hypothetical protein U1E05_05775 [Patescibacteria group bacterium]|nr:hypothetical protein [Patescibacteria group bacterium]